MFDLEPKNIKAKIRQQSLVIAVAVMVWNYKLAREIKNLKDQNTDVP